MSEVKNKLANKLFEEFLNLKEIDKLAFLQMIFIFFENKKSFWKVWKLIPFPYKKLFYFLLLLFLKNNYENKFGKADYKNYVYENRKAYEFS